MEVIRARCRALEGQVVNAGMQRWFPSPMNSVQCTLKCARIGSVAVARRRLDVRTDRVHDHAPETFRAGMPLAWAMSPSMRGVGVA